MSGNLFLRLGLSMIFIVLSPRGLSSPSRELTEANKQNLSIVDHCPPLPPATGNITPVSSVDELELAVDTAPAGTTILLADGVYNLDGINLLMDTANVTLRSASGDRETVILDGNYLTNEIIKVEASQITIADLTIREAYHHPVHVVSSTTGHTFNTRLYNLYIINPGQQSIKINPDAEGYYPDYGEIACSHIELTDAGRPRIWEINNRCYTGGVDAHQALSWVVRDNLIQGFWCDQDLSEHAIHFWRGGRDTTIERNILRDNARGIGLGLATAGTDRTYPDNPCPSAEGSYVDHYLGLIRNNFIFAGRSELFDSQFGFDCGICLWNACNVTTVHNTVASTQAPFSSIEWRFDNSDVYLANNLLTHNLRDRGGSANLADNLEYQPLSLFVNGPGGDLHLVETASVAIDQGTHLSPSLIIDDIDGDPRPSGSGLDIGADEYGFRFYQRIYLPVVTS